MPYTVSLRRFRPSDMEAVLAIERAGFGVDAYPAELFAGYHRRCPELFLVATALGRLAGYSIAFNRKDRAELVSIAVLPRYRRGGVGQALLRGTIRRLCLRRIGRLSLMVKAGNLAALQFYRRFGFERVRLVRQYYEDGADGIRLSRRL